ncbi:hypothetical protein FQN53_003671 [Emmonsiellopsis sp. PD_33]|nr:hypothetical protein FQN53_003671 [Emmonsiellopsis sp. PD_33]
MAPLQSPGTWLPSLKLRQLQRLASLTGVLSSGTKPVLVKRLDQAFQVHATDSRQTCHDVGDEEASIDSSKTASILSIDMGIRNLAFAHLTVPPIPAGRTKTGEPETPILTAWYRLAVSSFLPNSTSEDRVLDFNLGEEMGPKKKSVTKRKSETSKETEDETTSESQLRELSNTTEKEKESFAPKLYAAHAYTLMSSLLATYKPTHILIERQRFRSGGGSSVQEWTIRVGVFEGMLYAVLRAIQQERKGELAKIIVQGVEPQRVMRYWMDEIDLDSNPRKGKRSKKEKDPTMPGQEEDTKKKKATKMTPTLRKQIKIDRIGTLLSSCTGASKGPSIASTPGKDLGDHLPIQLGYHEHLHLVVDAFLRKWDRKTNGKSTPVSREAEESHASKSQYNKASAKDSAALQIDKLDDLADCLLQAMTWLEWQNTRQRIAQRGFDAVSAKVGG